MNFSTLLAQRQKLLRQARLANLAFAYQTLRDFALRIARARLSGSVMLRHASPDADRYWATLTALDCSQAVIEEHFSDQDLMDFADVLAFITGHDAVEITFRLEELNEVFLVPLRVEMEREGITLDETGTTTDAIR